MKAYEVNFDGLVGLTHNYSGLSFGNTASMASGSKVSNPKEAAKQGLQKLKFLHDLGIKQGVLLPHERPDVHLLRKLGFEGNDTDIIRKASKTNPDMFSACCSASAMWAANSATVSPSADTKDGRVHFTPANLSSKLHRSIETATTSRILKAIFVDEKYFCHHAPLPACDYFGDEGAANHTRFCREYGKKGVELFVYGRYGAGKDQQAPVHFPARHTFEASDAISRLHRLDKDRVVMAQQNPQAIDAGVFHNDVVAVGNQNVFFYHEKAFINTKEVCCEIREKFGDHPFHFIEVKEGQVSLDDAVKSYLFNSQLITLKNSEMMIIVPDECRKTKSTWNYLQELIKSNKHIKQIKSFDLRQSMLNGGGPACLRLRVVLNKKELEAVSRNVLLNESLYEKLSQWIIKHYRDKITYEDLSDPMLLNENRAALDELTQITQVGSVYTFQLP